MRKLILLILLIPTCLLASPQKAPHLICQLDERRIEVDLSQKLNSNSDFSFKIEFFVGSVNFGDCIYKIDSELDAGKSISPWNQYFISKQSCKFISEKQSKDLMFVDNGVISYSAKEYGKLDLLAKHKPLKCTFKK